MTAGEGTECSGEGIARDDMICEGSRGNRMLCASFELLEVPFLNGEAA